MRRQAALSTTALPLVRTINNSRLKIAIMERGVSQTAIAKALGISVFRLSRIVRGRIEPTDDEQDRLSEILEQPRRKLFRVIA